MIKRITFVVLVVIVNFYSFLSASAQNDIHDCGEYQYCFEWEEAEYVEDYGTYCDDMVCAYPPDSSACFLSYAHFAGTWCGYTRDDYTQADLQPNTSPLPLVWTIPSPPDDLFDGDDQVDTPTPTPIPQETDAQCPGDMIVQSPIRVSGELVDPPFPVVVGQDPAKRGADLVWRVEIPPVIHTWYEKVTVDPLIVCSYVGDGSGEGCPEPESQYDVIEGAPGWDPQLADDPNWQVYEREVIECVENVTIYTEHLNWIRVAATLSQDSRDWIEHGGLQQRYPGARLYQPDWEWMPLLFGNVLSDGTYIWEWGEEEIQFRDPGQYGMGVKGGTSGTPVTDPRFFDLEAGEFSVWLYEATLTK
jgi:hypothetical protein